MIDILSNAPMRKAVKIIEIKTDCIQKNRLSDLGIIENSYIMPMFNAISKELTAYLIKDSLIAIRKSTTKLIKIMY